MMEHVRSRPESGAAEPGASQFQTTSCAGRDIKEVPPSESNSYDNTCLADNLQGIYTTPL